MLSNDEIIDELGKNIYIYPLNPENIRGSSFNLTASKYAWSLKTKESIVTDGIIIIPPSDTALIMTQESIYVTSKISGTYHSKVTLASGGIGHIGTILDPMWVGNSLIALHNTTSDKYEIKLNDAETIVSICFYYTGKPSTLDDRQNTPGQIPVLSRYKINISREEISDLQKDWRGNKSKLIEAMKSSDEYKKLKSVSLKSRKLKFDVFLFVVFFLIPELMLYYFQSKISFRVGSLQLWEILILVGLSGFIMPLLSKADQLFDFLFIKQNSKGEKK